MDKLSSVEQSIQNAEAYLSTTSTSRNFTQRSNEELNDLTIAESTAGLPFGGGLVTSSETMDMRQSLDAIRLNNDLPLPSETATTTNNDNCDDDILSEDSLTINEEDKQTNTEEDDVLFYASDVNRVQAPAVAWTLDVDALDADNINNNNDDANNDNNKNDNNSNNERRVLKPKPKLTSDSRNKKRSGNDTREEINKIGKNLTRSAIEGIEKHHSNLTFQPKVNHNAKAPLRGDVHDRLAMMAEQKGERQRERESKKITEDARSARKYTFKPEITKKGSKRGDNVKKTASRLYHDADERNMVRECTRYHLQEQKMSEYTFKVRSFFCDKLGDPAPEATNPQTMLYCLLLVLLLLFLFSPYTTLREAIDQSSEEQEEHQHCAKKADLQASR